MIKYINLKNFKAGLKNFKQKKPFPYAVIDNFFKKDVAKKLEREFPSYNNKNLHVYNNYCEVKKSLNNWNFFPPLTYKVFSALNSYDLINQLSKKLKISTLFPDYGLHGGGWHLMNIKGKLNSHLDYSIHPKIYKQRKFNLIIFLTADWKEKWGGETCIYYKNKKNSKIPGRVGKRIYPKFNRALFFDTSKSSWHSVDKIKAKKIRKTIAIYYLASPPNKLLYKKQKALYAPTKSQEGNKKVLKFIKARSNSNKFSKVYKTRKK